MTGMTIVWIFISIGYAIVGFVFAGIVGHEFALKVPIAKKKWRPAVRLATALVWPVFFAYITYISLSILVKEDLLKEWFD